MVEISLTEEEKVKLLRIARESVKNAASGSKKEKADSKEASGTKITEENLKMEAGAFVSLHKKGKLRGCIGRFEAEGPLFETVERMARAASISDFRFSKVTPDEVEDLDIEISVLSPLKRIRDVSEIEVGRHGLYIIRGLSRGTLLPQVASERGWDRDTFLEQTCIKAGLDRDAWEDKKTEIYTYEALVFGEE
ncbi:MAG: AmmeMemoRadiSam system protein A [Deltaproteobacteria bacterium]|uniref:AmmeMemoRadiSam system protein A n=1 Tax=Candidatus Zymogenus saltonus TaxID=2844893 RepID=A0A9D8PPX5_9DELT|nr:AmmeMemoRadiSam system protein A [Candidatus Zymogenus saltonus]